MTALDLNKRLNRSRKRDGSHTCAPISELPSNIGTVCPESSDPPEKNILIYLIKKLGLHRFLTITIF